MAVGDTVEKIKLSGSTDGKGIKITATSSPGTHIHTAVSGTSNFDEIWLYCYNSAAAATVLYLQCGSTDADNLVQQTITSKNGFEPVIPGLILDNSASLKAYSATASELFIYGFVNQMTT